jgi:3-oxoacyl-[acyl-carrier protein] reductase
LSAGPAAIFRLDGRAAVVTGAASGIGRATAKLLAEAGARVLAADLDAAGLAELDLELGEGGASRLTDVTDRAQVEALLAEALERFGRLDALANVAGILRTATIAELSDDDLEAILGVNLRGTLNGCRAAAPIMAEQGSGSIVNISSSAAFKPFPGLGAYTISKAGVVALTRVLASELGQSGVRVNAVAPGMVDTPMAGRHFRDSDGGQTREQREAMLADARRRSVLGTEGFPADVANSVLFLVSDAARYMTGQVLHPNGGSPMV